MNINQREKIIKQRQLNATKRHFNTTNKNAKDLLDSTKEINKINIHILKVCE